MQVYLLLLTLLLKLVYLASSSMLWMMSWGFCKKLIEFLHNLKWMYVKCLIILLLFSCIFFLSILGEFCWVYIFPVLIVAIAKLLSKVFPCFKPGSKYQLFLLCSVYLNKNITLCWYISGLEQNLALILCSKQS